MKLKNKGTRAYLFSVFIVTFIAFVIPSVALYFGSYGGIILSACLSMLNAGTACCSWILAKPNRKNNLLKWHLGLNSCITLLLLGIFSVVITNCSSISLCVTIFIWLGIFNMLPITLSYAIYTFIQRNDAIKNNYAKKIKTRQSKPPRLFSFRYCSVMSFATAVTTAAATLITPQPPSQPPQ